MNPRRHLPGNANLRIGAFSSFRRARLLRRAAPSFLAVIFALLFCASLPVSAFAQRPDKDYLSPIEADKIRDAETPNERIKLFLTFAEDRLTKFKYELEHPSPNKHGEMLNYLMNAYIGCVDDAADLIQLGIEKQDNIRQGIDLMASKAQEFLDALKKYEANGPELDVYKDNLDDAVEGTEDALREAQNAKKKAAPPPVRRKN